MTTIHLLAPILKHRGTPLAYDHTDPNRTLENLIVEAETPPPTPSEYEAVFGPSWPWVAALVETLAAASESELARLVAARDSAWDSAREAAREAAWDATLWAGWGATRDATRDAARGAPRVAARDATWATFTHHLIGVGGYTQEHYNTLIAPFESVFGKLTPAVSIPA